MKTMQVITSNPLLSTRLTAFICFRCISLFNLLDPHKPEYDLSDVRDSFLKCKSQLYIFMYKEQIYTLIKCIYILNMAYENNSK